MCEKSQTKKFGNSKQNNENRTRLGSERLGIHF